MVKQFKKFKIINSTPLTVRFVTFKRPIMEIVNYVSNLDMEMVTINSKPFKNRRADDTAIRYKIRRKKLVRIEFGPKRCASAPDICERSLLFVIWVKC